MGPWSGSRLICIGDYVEPNDYPPELQDDDELIARINEVKDAGSSPNLFALCDYFRKPRAIYRDCKPALRSRLPTRTLRDVSNFGLPSPAIDRLCSEFNQWIGPITDDTQTELVVRNLSKSEYIRQSGIEVSLGNALYSQICWSSDPSTSMSCPDLHRGDWAGDRFELCSLATHLAKVEEDGSD